MHRKLCDNKTCERMSLSISCLELPRQRRRSSQIVSAAIGHKITTPQSRKTD